MNISIDAAVWQPLTFQSTDGLELFARDYRPAGAGAALPLVCLPGLTRNSADFNALAARLSSHTARPRRVLALDFRGRGLSAHDSDWTHYAPPVEMEDVCALLDEAGLQRCHILGTSRGGIVGMMLAALDPGRIASLVLNDLGPVLELDGLKRICAYAVDPVAPPSWQAAEDVLRQRNGAAFSALDAIDWARFARQIFLDAAGKPALAYDPALGKTLTALDLDNPLGTLWPLFDALSSLPVMGIRGENSDLLAPETFAEMQRRRPDMVALSVAGQGHAPLLWDAPTTDAIAAFLASSE